MSGPLWKPGPDRIAGSALRAYLDWLEEHAGRSFADHDALWAWSVADVDRFWRSIVDYYAIEFSSPWTRVRTDDPMPHTRWFAGATLNWAEHALRRGADDATALVCVQEGGRPEREISYGELRRAVAAAAGVVAPGRRATGRPRRGLPAEHRARGDRLPCRRRGRRGVGVLLAGLRRRRHHRPARPARADRADRRRRLPLERQGRSTAREVVAQLRAGLPTRAARRPRRRTPSPTGPPRRARRRGTNCSPRDEPLAVRAGRVLASAVGAVHLRHDRAAQGPGARPRRDHAGGHEVVRPVRRPARRASACSPTPRPAGRCGTCSSAR